MQLISIFLCYQSCCEKQSSFEACVKNNKVYSFKFFIFRKKKNGRNLCKDSVFVNISQTHWSISGSLTLFNILSCKRTHTQKYTHTLTVVLSQAAVVGLRSSKTRMIRTVSILRGKRVFRETRCFNSMHRTYRDLQTRWIKAV